MMKDSYTKESLCAGMLEDVRAVAGYMRERAKPRLNGILDPSQRELCAKGIFLRSLCWMETLARLDRPQDFQAVGTCTRFLFETCVDLVLVDHNQKGDLTERMSDWATSAKFKAAEQAVKFYRARGKKVPDVHESLELFYDENGGQVQTLRSKHWNSVHPDRWTGSDLLSDCRTADGFEPVRIPDELGMGLVEFYETQVRRLNWLVHGSGVAILEQARAPWFFLTCAMGFKWSSDLAVLISTLTMKALHFDIAIENIDSERKRLRRERQEALFEQLEREPS
jgi:hypothetical protein